MKNFKKITIVLIASFVFSLLASGCGDSVTGSSEPSSESASASEPASSQNPVHEVVIQIPSSAVPAAEPTSEPTSSEAPSAGPSSGDDLSKVIALTFDDGPSTNTPSSTSRILDVLEKYNAKATFFVQGIQLTYAEFKDRNCAIVKREAALGMQIGSHSFDHPDFNKKDAAEIQSQIDKSIQLISDAAGGYDVKIVRTPYGSQKQHVLDAIDMPIILWNIDTMDWDTKDADKTYQAIMDNVKGGSIVLMHDIYQATADAVEMVVPALIEKGYKLVTIDEMFRLYGQELKPHTVYARAKRPE
ncbi:MAG: polysaccharide deacetylase family protein [Lachnospiraceae bacterium]|nr:polysaccharide deacetylase family protein [Lachnospiraceae bacterium]